MQTDQELFLQYLLAFLQSLEQHIQNLAPSDIEPTTSPTNHFAPTFALADSADARCRKKLLEMRDLLMKIRSIRTGSGDSFFVSLARTFFASGK